MDPVMSWALFGTGVVAIGGYYYYTENQKKIARAREVGGRRRSSQARMDSKEKRTKGRDSGSSDHVVSDSADVPSITGGVIEGAKKRKGNKNQPSKLSQSSAIDVKVEPSTDFEEQEDEGMDNTAFAEQFSSKQTGTDLRKPPGPADKQRSKRQGKHNKATSQTTNGTALMPNRIENPQQPSAASSTTGADADDDLSPVYSPELGATSNTMPSAADVSDMLEAPAKGPSVLNITASANPQPVKQPRQQKPVQEPETKRQRQNRKKKEEQRLLREEAEKERRVLLERQLRTVREAEGRPAKNGLGVSKTPASNPWSKSMEINGGLKAPPSSANQSDTPLLDTLDDGQSSAYGAASVSASGANGESSPQAASTSTFTSNTDMPSEEEQLRIISEMDSDNAWSTVNKGGKAKKNKAVTAAETVPNNSTSFDKAKNRNGNQQPASKFAALDVEHSTEEPSNLDKEEEAVALTQPVYGVSVIPSGDENNVGRQKEEVASDGSVRVLSTIENGDRLSTGTPANGIRTFTTTAAKSVTGLVIPQFVHPRPHEMWITRNTAAEELPEGWYHFDNGCHYGNAKIPQHDYEYERELQKYTRWNPEGQVNSYDHRMKSNLEKDAYERCFLVYRAHVARSIDLSKWNKDNIKQHPAYEPDWPWALLPHPSEGWGAGFHDPNRKCNICEDYSR